MTLKKYTLIGLIGFLFLFINSLYWVITPIYEMFSYNFEFSNDEFSRSIIFNMLKRIARLIGYIFIIIFFLKLYTKQKDQLWKK